MVSVFWLSTPQHQHLVVIQSKIYRKWSVHQGAFCFLVFLFASVFQLSTTKINTWRGHPIRKLISASRRICFICLCFFRFQSSTDYPLNKHLLWSFNKNRYQCIEAHTFYLLMFLLASVLRQFTPQNKHLLWSFNQKNDQFIEAHLFYLLMLLLASAYVDNTWIIHRSYIYRYILHTHVIHTYIT